MQIDYQCSNIKTLLMIFFDYTSNSKSNSLITSLLIGNTLSRYFVCLPVEDLTSQVISSDYDTLLEPNYF